MSFRDIPRKRKSLLKISARNRFVIFAATGYALFAFIWIFLSDQLLISIIDINKIRWLSTFKGYLFVLITSMMLVYALYSIPTTNNVSPHDISIQNRKNRIWVASWRYSFAIAITLAFMVLRANLDLNEKPLMVVFMFPIILSAMFGGLGPGLLSTILAALYINIYFINPIGTLHISDQHDLFQYGFLISSGILVSILSEMMQRNRQKIESSQAHLARVIEGANQGFWDWNLQTNEFHVSPRFATMLDFAPGEWQAGPEQWVHQVHPEDLPKALESINQHLKGLTPTHEIELRCKTKSGEWKWILTQGKIVEWDKNGQPLMMSGTHTDISERKKNENTLKQAAAVFENTQEGVVVTDAEIRITMVNKAFTRLTGYSAEEVIGRNPSFLKSGRHDPHFYQEMWENISNFGYWQGELWNRRKNGEIYPELQSISAVRDNDGQISHYVSVFMDISNLKASEEQLEFLAHHDPLTQLPNRLLLFSRLEMALSIARRDNTQLALLMFDLDHFKDINDSFGHPCGDQLLQQVAQRLAERLRTTDFLARLGGDEFTVLLENLPRPEDAARVAGDLIAALEAPFHLDNNIEVRTGASMGISLFPSHGATAETLLQQADAAMYRAKAEGRGRFQYFSESLTHTARERIKLDLRLRRAIVQQELRVFYQPQIDIKTGCITGAEALVRWLDPEQGLIPPGRFIPIAEETGLIREIGEWVLRETCRQGRSWLDAGLPPLILAVNVSAHQIRHGKLGEMVERILEETGFPAKRLELELTESALMEEREDIVQLFNQLREKQIRLAIDDFGTGYSSLAYLKRFPLDVLKIDKSFVDDIACDRDDREITMAIIAMGHALGFKILAEGVETTEQLEFLETNGCDLYQGFLHSQPLAAEVFHALLLKNSSEINVSKN